MDQLIGLSIFIATVFGGTWMAHDILVETKTAALTKASQGLPKLSSFSHQLTSSHHNGVAAHLKKSK